MSPSRHVTIYKPTWEKNTGTAMVICPGGGYWDLYWGFEGEEVAAWLNSQGMTGIILKYRCPRRPGEAGGEPPLGPQLDAQRAISLVRSRAAEWRSQPSGSAWLASRRAAISPWRPRPISRSGCIIPIDAIDQVTQARFRRPVLFGLSAKDKDKDEIHRVSASRPIRLRFS